MVKMFLGEYQPNITEGSRIALPKKLRNQINGDTVVLARGFEKCVFIYDSQEWQKESDKQFDNSITDKRTRELKRYMFGNATEAPLDSQGRVVIPTALKDYAGLTDKTTVIGAGDHIELWDSATWDTYLAKISQELAA